MAEVDDVSSRELEENIKIWSHWKVYSKFLVFISLHSCSFPTALLFSTPMQVDMKLVAEGQGQVSCFVPHEVLQCEPRAEAINHRLILTALMPGISLRH